jgi:hypothetical protein
MDVSTEAVLIVWGGSLVLGLVVIGVVALLLHLVRNTAQEIDETAGHIWTQGKLVANNTIQIPTFLSTTNSVASKILHSAGNIAEGTNAIKNHADGCPGCPACVLKNERL